MGTDLRLASKASTLHLHCKQSYLLADVKERRLSVSLNKELAHIT